jgi:hypothetical protein
MKKMNVLFLVTMFLGSLTSATSFAQGRGQRFVLDFYDQEYRGGDTLYLKAALRDQYPRVNIRRLELDSAWLVAKTRLGRGTAALLVGDTFSRDEVVYGRPDDFYNPNPRTFDRVQFYNPSWDSTGVWQFHLNGEFIVRQVILQTHEAGRRRDDGNRDDEGRIGRGRRDNDGRIGGGRQL